VRGLALQQSGESQQEVEMKTRRLSITPGTALAGAALFLALGGSALAVGERVHATMASQQPCAQGALRGIAHVTGGPGGAANIPARFSGARALFARRFNCAGRAVQVRRLGIGVYEIRFAANGAPNAIASGVGGVQSSAERIGTGTFRVNVYPAGRSDPADLPFVVVLV
jgi:hypothetical protein